MAEKYWETKPLAEMSAAEWESLCDGCALCCMHKVEDEDTGDIFYTDLACRLLDLQTCRCTDYANRVKLVSDCMDLLSDPEETFSWLPPSCAYRLLSEGRELPPWHPLVTGDPESVHQADISVRGKVMSENDTSEWSLLWDVSGYQEDDQ